MHKLSTKGDERQGGRVGQGGIERGRGWGRKREREREREAVGRRNGGMERASLW